MCFHRSVMRVPRALVALLAASAVLVAACAGDGGDERASGVVEPPVASSSASPSVSPSPVVRSVSFSPVDAGMLGMHVAGAQEGDWPGDSVPVSSLRLWDTGTSWLQIEATRGRYDWRGLDTALATASAAGVSDVLMVLGPTPVWNASP